MATEASEPPVIPSSLSRRERQILGLVAAGRSNAEIADELYLSRNTVKTYIRTAYTKIGARNRAHAVAWAYLSGFVPSQRSG